MKKFVKVILAVLSCAFMLAGVAACGDNGNDPENPGAKAEKKLTLDKYSIELVIGDEYKIGADYLPKAGVSIEYESSDGGVATVSADGVITGQNVGNTSITVTYGEESAKANVSVSLGGMAPALETVQLNESDIKLYADDKVNLASRVSFNGKYFTDAEVEYTVSDPEVGVVEDGIFIPSQKGVTTVYITAKWRGMETASLTKEVKISVIKSVAIAFDEGEFTLYTLPVFDGKTYDTEKELIVRITDNGASKDNYSVTIESGENVVEYDSVTKTMKAKAFGEASLKVSYVDGENETHVKSVKVTVVRPSKTLDATVEFSEMDGVLPLEEMFASSSVTLIEAYQGSTALNVADNKVTGLKLKNDEVTETEISVYTATACCVVNLNAYKKIIKTAADLAVFDVTDNTKVLTGYFVLANDIDYDASAPVNRHEGLVRRTDNGEPKWLGTSAVVHGFGGTFDGKGHYMSFGVYQAGLFGELAPGAKIVNVAMKDVVFTNTANDMSVVVASQAPWSETSGNEVYVKNVYISVKDFRTALDGNNTSAFMHTAAQYIYMENVIIDVKRPAKYEARVEADGEKNFASGAVYVQNDKRSTNSDRFLNVYVITGGFMFVSMDTVKSGKRDRRVVAENDGDRFASDPNYIDTVNEDRLHGISRLKRKWDSEVCLKRYDTFAELAASGNNFNAFSALYWDFGEGAPVFKSVK